MELHVFLIPIPPPTSLSTRFLWVFPVHQVRALVLCIQPGLVICFTIDNIHASMLFFQNIPPSPSPTESKVCSYMQNRKRDTDVQNRLSDSVGEGRYSYLSVLFSGTLHSVESLSLSPFLLLLFFPQLFVKPLHTTTLPADIYIFYL